MTVIITDIPTWPFNDITKDTVSIIVLYSILFYLFILYSTYSSIAVLYSTTKSNNDFVSMYTYSTVLWLLVPLDYPLDFVPLD